MSLTFRYKRMDYGKEGTFAVPKIPMVISGKSSLVVMGLLDSGATHAFIPRKIAEIIQLDLDDAKEQNVTAIGSRIKGLETTMSVSIEGERGKRHQGTVPVTVLDDSEVDEIIIGRQGIFNMFRITFHENEKYVVLKPYPESKIPEFIKE